MKTFKEQLEAILGEVNGLITKETPTDQITKFGQLKDDLKALGDSHQQTLDEYGELKDRYIESIKGFGTNTKPNDDTNKGEKTFEEIGAEILANAK